MARAPKGPKGPTKVSVPSRPSFVLGSRPPDMYAPRVAPRPQGNIMSAPPRIKPALGVTQYGKSQSPAQGPGFGLTGLTGET